MESRGWRDLLERVAKLEEEQERQKKLKESCDTSASDLGLFMESFCKNGFSREESMEILKMAFKINK